MLRSTRAIAVCVVMLGAAPARADWLPVGTSTNDSIWFMDGGRVKSSGGKVHAWVKIDHSKDRSVTWRESKRLFSFDCTTEKYKMLSYVNYDTYGKVVASQSFSDSSYGIGYEPIIPESMVETIGDVACAIVARAPRQ
jgi:hypothetical protein